MTDKDRITGHNLIIVMRFDGDYIGHRAHLSSQRALV